MSEYVRESMNDLGWQLQSTRDGNRANTIALRKLLSEIALYNDIELVKMGLLGENIILSNPAFVERNERHPYLDTSSEQTYKSSARVKGHTRTTIHGMTKDINKD